jgi:hypothetical protein
MTGRILLLSLSKSKKVSKKIKDGPLKWLVLKWSKIGIDCYKIKKLKEQAEVKKEKVRAEEHLKISAH